MDDKIFITDGEKNKCPHCGITYSFENAFEVLYRNITLLHMKKDTLEITLKCKQCKSLLKVKK